MFWSDFQLEPPVGSQVELGGSEGKHASSVRRMRVGEAIQLTDGAGLRVRGSVSEVLPKVRLAREHVRSGHLRLFIEVDGGIAADTIDAAAEALLDFVQRGVECERGRRRSQGVVDVVETGEGDRKSVV